jgi:hypothetical protein
MNESESGWDINDETMTGGHGFDNGMKQQPLACMYFMPRRGCIY